MLKNEKNAQNLTITFQEGSAHDYFKNLKETIGGQHNEHSYVLNNPELKVRIDAFNHLPGIEFTMYQFKPSKPLIIHRTPDNDPQLIHINFALEGQFNQVYDNKSSILQANSNKGIFIYNGLFPITIEIAAHTEIKLFGIKVHTNVQSELTYDGTQLIKRLFENASNGLAFHLPVHRNEEKLIEDAFYYNQQLFQGPLMITSRGLELFSNLCLQLDKLNIEEELHGLQAGDYERLQLIKKQLLESFHLKISIEQLAEQYGVSMSKLKRDFKTLFNTSVYNYYTNAKMKEAYRLLKSGQYTVSEVGYDLGYSNLSKFSDMFKKTFGVLPSEV